MNLTLAAIRRPVWVLMLMLAAVVLGWLGLSKMQVELNPEVDFPVITIQTSYFGAGPEEIETLITRKIEETVSTTNGLKAISSTSLEGQSIVAAEFILGTDLDAALTDVSSKVEAITGQLPQDARKPVVSKMDIAGEPVLTLAVESESLNALQLRDLVEDRAKDRFSRIPGVAQVVVSGGQVREIRVAVDRQRLLSYGLGISDALLTLQGASQDIPGGRITEGRRETSVRVKGEFTSVEDIRNLAMPLADVMEPGRPPAIVRMSDIATVTDGPAERSEISRVNGRDAVIVSIQKARDGNTVEITERAKEAMFELEETYPFSFTITQEAARQVKESLDDLKTALIIGIVLVVGIIYLFLHNLRGTLIVALAIPTCLFAAFAAIHAMGFTLNVMTMLGLSLAIGILVDDAIVVLENIYRHLAMGESPKEAALNGRMEIGLAAVSITMVDLAVFVPVAMMGGIVGMFFRPFALTVAAATLFSLLVSFTLTPMLASRWYREGENLEEKRGFAKWFENKFNAFAARYRRALNWSLHHRWFVVIASFGMLIGVFLMIGGGFAPNLTAAVGMSTGIAASAFIVGLIAFLVSWLALRRFNLRIPAGAGLFALAMVGFAVGGHMLAQNKGGPIFNFRFAPAGDSGLITALVTMPPGSSLERTLSVVERIERAAMEVPETDYVVSRIGSQSTGFGAANQGSQFAQVTVTLKEKRALIDSLMFWKSDGDLRTRRDQTIAIELQQKIGKVPDAQIFVSALTGFSFGPDVQVAVSSLDPGRVLPAAIKAKEALAGIEGIVNLDLSSKPGKPELVIRPDRVKLADNDLPVNVLGAVVRTLYEGNIDLKYREGGREYDVRINLSDDVRHDSSAISSIPIIFRQGNPVFLGDVAKIESGVGPDKIERQDRQREVIVSGYLLPGYVIGTMGAAIDAALAEADLGEGVTFTQRGENEMQADEAPFMGQAFMLALILVFMVMAALFDNILYPLIIQLAQPQALVGALIALMITNTPMDIVGMIGVIMLVGLVGKNAILLVDYTNTLRRRGYGRDEALLEAGPIRLRPIMMTTMALVLAMVPIALALGRGSEFRAPMGIVIIGGLTLSTVLTLLVIPASYTIFDDLSNWVGRVLFRRKPPEEPPNPEPEAREPTETRSDD
ncbi:MAG: efflux RND transporter permease subunit [Armatimonadetes bacterium]|nr:efflux RND transporter permease subunit [Armatimonadota bacterium]